MKINLKKVVSYQVETKKGPVLFEKVSEWSGMVELKDCEGRKLIVSMPVPTFGGFLREQVLNLNDETASVVMTDPVFAGELVAVAE